METKITIDNIVEFIHKAISQGLTIDCYNDTDRIYYNIGIEKNKKIMINFRIDCKHITISTTNIGFVVIDNIISDRDKLKLESLMLDIKEYNEKVALNIFNNFFDKDKENITIDDLDNDDDN